MTYDKYYNILIKRFEKCINCKDTNLKNKIFNALKKWYLENYENKIKQAIKDNNFSLVEKISEEIEFVCNKPDIIKLKLISKDDKFNQVQKISNDIFLMVKDGISNNKFTLTNDEYTKLEKFLLNAKNDISLLYQKDYQYHLSECLLDLSFLLNKGNVDFYSIRASKYLDSKPN